MKKIPEFTFKAKEEDIWVLTNALNMNQFAKCGKLMMDSFVNTVVVIIVAASHSDFLKKIIKALQGKCLHIIIKYI